MSTMYSQDSLPDAVKVPAGNKVVLQTVGVGEILYECRAKKDMPGQFEWTFVGPDAVLKDRSGMQVGRYYGPPATWESSDGSKVTGAQVAVAPAGTGNIRISWSGQSGHRHGRHDADHLYPARRHQGRRGAGRSLRHGFGGCQAEGGLPGRLYFLESLLMPAHPSL
jgi:hypothetical protein